jgi:carboxypeptidase family protein/TonB-dependent receptor-like protein
MLRILQLCVVTFIICVLTCGAFGQGAATGDLHVTVKDPKDALVTNATVTARDQAKGLERSTSQNVEGEYRVLALPPGKYMITVEAPGFTKAQFSDITITVGQMADLPVTLGISGGETIAEVSSEAAIVETQRSSSTDTINQTRIDNLPINGRNYINFALTDSRIARDTAPSIGAAPTSGLNFSGQRARANLVNVDGADAVDNSTNGIRSTVSQEAVQEFQIITNGYSAEYGRSGGGVVNIITRSGTNDMHGSVYGYLRNRNFQAVNPFSTVKDPAYTRVQAGAAFGGALKKDKTFYYFSYEGTWRQETGFSSIGANGFGLVDFDGSAYIGAPPGSFPIKATPEQVAFLTNPATLQGIQADPNGFGKAVGQYVGLVGRSSGMALDGVWPGIPQVGGGVSAFPTSCTAPPCPPVPASYVSLNSLIGNFPVSEHTDLYSLRLDHNFSAANRLSLRGGVSPSDVTGIQVQAQGPQNFGQNAFSRTSVQNYHDWNITAQDTWTIGNNKVNEASFQYSRRGLLYSFSRGPGGGNVAVNIPGFAFFGREPFSFVRRTEQRYQFKDNVSWSAGSHTFKFGVDGNYLPLSADFTVNFGGIYNFGSRSLFPTPFPAFSPIQTYGAGIPSNFIQGIGGPHDAFSNTALAGFIQDTWRIKSNLTLNYGVRYDVELTPTFKAINALSQAAQNSLGITQGIPRDTNNVAPRIGLAWDPRKDGKTVIRASYGLFYDHPLLALAFDSDVADGAQAPQLVLFPGAPGGLTPLSPDACTPPNLNASNAFQGLLGCLPAAFNYLANEQRFNPAPNAPSIFVGQAYLQQPLLPIALQPFGFPTAKAFVYASAHQANLTFEHDLGNNMSIGLEYNFNGGRHLNRPINTNTVRPDLLIQNFNVAVSAGAANPNNGPLAVNVDAAGNPCGVNGLGQPWVSAPLVSFFRPSGLNPSMANFFTTLGGGACVALANQILAAEGLNASCDPTTLSGCIPFSDMPANFSNGSSVYHGLTANFRKRFSNHYEFLASYTWAHSIDDSTDLQSPLSPQDNYNPAAERANSLFDQRHRFVFSAVYQSGKVSGSGFFSKFFSDWTVAPIIEASSGRPFNIITGDDRNFDFGTTTDRPLTASSAITNSCGDTAAPSRSSPTGFLIPACFLDGAVVGNLGRNAGLKPTTVFTDLRIARTIRLGDRFRIEAIADAFNLINKFNVADVNPLWDSRQTPTAAFDPRQFQFALKVAW